MLLRGEVRREDVSDVVIDDQRLLSAKSGMLPCMIARTWWRCPRGDRLPPGEERVSFSASKASRVCASFKTNRFRELLTCPARHCAIRRQPYIHDRQLGSSRESGDFLDEDRFGLIIAKPHDRPPGQST